MSPIRDLPDSSPLRAFARAGADRTYAVLQDADLAWHPDYYEWYWAAGALFRPRRVLEIGVYGGGSTLALVHGARSVGHTLDEIVLIDNEDDGRPLEAARARVAAAAPTATVRALREDSQRLAELPGRGYDLVSVDGDHRVGPCYHDTRLALAALAPGGHVVCDDGSWPWVRQALDAFLAERPHLRGDFVRTKTGMIIVHACLDLCPLDRSSRP